MSEGTTTLLTEGGQQFFEHFYSYMDTGRSSLKHLYHEESKVVWNGTSIKGRENVERFMTDLPASKHDPCSLDCQPVLPQGGAPGGSDSADPMILVNVMGTVQYGHLEAKPPPVPRPFCQSFVLGKDTVTGSYFIVTDNYRLL